MSQLKRISIFVDLYNFLAYSSKYLGNNAFIDMTTFYRHFIKENEELNKIYIYGGSSMQGLLYKLSHYDFIEIIEENTGWDNKDKGTDVNLAVDLVSNAYRDTYDKAVILSGDADFIRAVKEVKLLSKEIYIATTAGDGIENARRLIEIADGFYALDVNFFKKYWIKNKKFIAVKHS